MFIVLFSHAIDCYLGNEVGIQLLVQAIIREVGNAFILIQCIVKVDIYPQWRSVYQETPLISFKPLGHATSQYVYKSGVSWSNRAEIMKGNGNVHGWL